MQMKAKTMQLTLTALLTAIAILLPIVMPIKIVIGPASFTLGSHVPIFMAMFFSPTMAVIVALGATIGFFIGGFPLVIVLRAFSHILFAWFGGKWLEKSGTDLLHAPLKSQLYSLVIGFLHALAEVLVVSFFFFGFLGVSEIEGSFFYTVFLLVGVGTLVHSMIDFLIAQWLWRTQENRFLILKEEMNA